jgi:uncharacterized protein YjbJ (UPF0337 family)
MNYTEQLERETERTRVDLANTVEELRERLTPGEVLDEVIDYASDGEVGAYLRNFRRQVIDNPLPLGLMGVSIAWLVAASAFGGRRSGRRMSEASTPTSDRLARRAGDFADAARDNGRAFADRAEDFRARASGQARDMAGRMSNQASNMAGRVTDQASDVAERAADRASDMAGYAADQASDIAGRTAEQAARIAGRASDQMANVAEQASATAARVGERVRSAASVAGANLTAAGDGLTDSMRSGARAIGDAATGIAQGGRSASRALADLGREQPLLVAATGLVLGALIGALLPSTQFEDELVGETSDAAKERLREVAGEQYEKAKDAAVRTAEAALDASGVTESAHEGGKESREGSEKRAPHEFGPGPGLQADTEHASGDHSAGAEDAEHTHAGST